MVEKLLTVKNRAGIHARPTAIISQTAIGLKARFFLFVMTFLQMQNLLWVLLLWRQAIIRL